MSYALAFLSEAAAELECITGNYEALLRGLGYRFRLEVESACDAVVQHPLLWRLRPQGYRRVNLPGFPYYIAYTIEDQQVIVVALAHASRRPDYFHSRMP